MTRVSFRYMPLIVLIFLVAVAMPSHSRADDAVTVPAGTVILVKMQSAVTTDEAGKGDPFTAILEKPVTVDGRTIFPRGANAYGKVIVAVDVGNISGRPGMGVHLVEVETESGTVSIKTLSQGFVGTTQGTVNRVVTGRVVGQANPGVIVNSSGRVTIKSGALIEFSLRDPVVVQ
jgi:hypothetical protein